MAFRTLGDLRGTLLARLGMGAMGASGGANQTLINSFLQEGQNFIYELQDWKHLEWYQDYTTGVGQNLYDYPDEASEKKRILRVETNLSGQFEKITEGITTAMWSTMDTQGPPARFERLAQILVYPKADQAYTLRVWYIKDLQPFTENNDRATVDDSLIFLHALANAKAHYRHPDAETYKGQLDTMVALIRGRSFKSVYTRDCAGEPKRKPMVVGRDV